MTASQIRASFLDFFKDKGHSIVPSAPMVVKDDPTLMFTNAGMNQWKDIILGQREPPSPRIADSQKCLRVSGKHNDLEEVGHDTYHHTMFEMLGNWSFGDYFKQGAIDMAWEYLTAVVGLPKDDLYVTVFKGAHDEGLARDNEAAALWLRHVPEDHIIDGNKHDNFWEMGDTGPCGPCSEIHLDSRSPQEKAETPGQLLVNKDHPQVIEIWNLVFMQYERKADGHLEPLGMNVIDTGMGLERLVRALQGKTSNYDTDIFQPIIHTITSLTGVRYGDNEETDVACRVCADHLRTIAFSIADGQLPGNAKAGYVIRRILRRAVRYAYTFLNQRSPFLYRLLPTLEREMGEAYPELKAQRGLIEKVVKEEEESFLRTLATGTSLLEAVINETLSQGRTQIDGAKAFTLFDTYGFPLDLTELICRERGLSVDEDAFNTEMQRQKQRARNAAQVENGDWVTLAEGEPTFTGWDTTEEHDCRILRYRLVKEKRGQHYQLVLSRSPFYAEMGGEVGDRGTLSNDMESVAVIDTKRENGLPVHIVGTLPADPTASFTATVDTDAREATEANHTCTHMLDAALREVLGKHVEQRGSLVTPQYLRFDFSHFQKVTSEELRQVERLVNQRIREDIPLSEHRDLPLDEAKRMGAIALFGEKYGERVRVVQFGDSVEFCGGCHAKSTGRLGMMMIVSESSVAAGVRRIEAITGKAVEEKLYSLTEERDELRSLLMGATDVKAAITKMMGENTTLRTRLEAMEKAKANEAKARMRREAKTVGGVKVMTAIEYLSPERARDIVMQLRAEEAAEAHMAGGDGDVIIVVGSIHEGKPMLTAGVSDSLVRRGVNAGRSIREAARHIEGGGGGQPHYATAGGKKPQGLPAAIDTLVAILTNDAAR